MSLLYIRRAPMPWALGSPDVGRPVASTPTKPALSPARMTDGACTSG
jgi:hypothetical protein